MKRLVYVLAIILALGLVGCDKLNFNTNKKPESQN